SIERSSDTGTQVERFSTVRSNSLEPKLVAESHWVGNRVDYVGPSSSSTPTDAPGTNTEQQDIRQKLEQIKQVVAVLKPMDVANLPYAQWLDGQSQKNQLLMGADETELKLKEAEIRKLESHPEKAAILADEKAELAIMKDKMAKMTE